MPLPDWLATEHKVAHVHHRPSRPGATVGWPDWVSGPVREAFAARGIERPWAHQVAAAQAAGSALRIQGGGSKTWLGRAVVGEALKVADTDQAHALALALHRRWAAMYRSALGRN